MPMTHESHIYTYIGDGIFSICSGTPPLKPENLFPRSSLADFKGKERGPVGVALILGGGVHPIDYKILLRNIESRGKYLGQE